MAKKEKIVYQYKGNLESNIYMEDIAYEQDETIYSLKTKDEFKIGRFDVGSYLHGRCHLFALVANEITGNPVHILGLPDYHNPQKGNNLSTGVLLSHVYLNIGGQYTWDVEGTNELEQLIDKYSEIEELVYENGEACFDILTNSEENIKRIKAMMDKGYISGFAEDEKEHLKAYIQDVIRLKGNQTHKEYSEIYQMIENPDTSTQISPK